MTKRKGTKTIEKSDSEMPKSLYEFLAEVYNERTESLDDGAIDIDDRTINDDPRIFWYMNVIDGHKDGTFELHFYFSSCDEDTLDFIKDNGGRINHELSNNGLRRYEHVWLPLDLKSLSKLEELAALISAMVIRRDSYEYDLRNIVKRTAKSLRNLENNLRRFNRLNSNFAISKCR